MVDLGQGGKRISHMLAHEGAVLCVDFDVSPDPTEAVLAVSRCFQ